MVYILRYKVFSNPAHHPNSIEEIEEKVFLTEIFTDVSE